MKRRMDIIFFNIYNWYSELKLTQRFVDPVVMTLMAFTLSASFWIFLLYALCDHFFIHHLLQQNVLYICVLILGGILFNIFRKIFIERGQYLDIYSKYKDRYKTGKNRKRDLVISFTILYFPVLLLAIYSLVVI